MSLLKSLGLVGRRATAVEPHTFVERRAEARQPVFQEAILALEDYHKIRVVITDVSSCGARIQYSARVDLPFRVRLNAPTLKLNCWVRVVWQHDGSAGLEFPRDGEAHRVEIEAPRHRAE
jgi:hypothetical protein